MTVFTTSGAAVVKAGANVSATIPDTNGYADWISGAACVINVNSRYNFSDNYSALNADVKHILDDVSSSIVAINAISHDMSGYTSRIEAEDMVNILRDGVLRGLGILRDKKVVDFINAA